MARLTTQTTETSVAAVPFALSIQLTSWNGGEVGSGGGAGNVTFNVTSSVGLAAGPITLEYSTDSGATWNAWLAAQSGTSPLAVTLPNVNSGLMRFRATVTDAGGSTATDESDADFRLDNVDPSVSLTNYAGGQLAKGGASVAVTFTASDNNALAAGPISLDYSTDSGATWTSLATGQNNTGTMNVTVPAVDSATARFRVTATDAAGRTAVSVSAADFTIDNTPPSLTLTSFTGGQAVKPSTSQNISFTASDTNGFQANSLLVERSSDGGSTWTNVATGASNTSPYSWALGALADDNDYRIRVSITDAAGWTTSAASGSDFIVDGTAPQLSVGTFSYAGGQTTVMVRYKGLSLTATDALSTVTHFCALVGVAVSAQPSASDSCWVSVSDPLVGLTPAASVSPSNYTVPLPVSPGAYVISGFVKDGAGNVSSLTSAGAGTLGRDRYNVTYAPGQAPTFAASYAGSTDAPGAPPSSGDLTATSGSDVYLKWRITDDAVMPSTGLRIEYTTDDTNFTSVVANLNPAGNNGTACTFDGVTYTGCYRWTGGSPSSGYYRIRLTATDSDGMATYNSPSPLNVFPPINFLAGNTESNLGASASTATFNLHSGDNHSFVVASDGTVYIRDLTRGILKINPADGNITTFLAKSGVQTNTYEGAVSGASVYGAYNIGLDWQDRLLIMDSDRIRRYDPATGNITNFIGGGAQTANGTTAANFQLSAYSGITWANRQDSLFESLPNGDLLFSDNGNVPRIYSSGSGTISQISPTGTGTSFGGAVSLADCVWVGRYFGFTANPSTLTLTGLYAGANHGGSGTCAQGSSTWSSVWLNTATYVGLGSPYPPHPGTTYLHSGRDGNLYAYHGDRVYRYNSGGNNWTTILGTATVGACSAGTLATACNVALQAIWVTRTSELYFVDNNRVRLVDTTGVVRDIYGQSNTYGDGGPALAARFGTIKEIAAGTAGKISIVDSATYLIREFTIGGNIATIAGNGSFGNVTTGVAATSSPLRAMERHVQDPATGDVYLAITGNTNGAIGRLNRTTGQWSTFIGLGGTLYESADGLSSTAIQVNGYPAALFAFNGTSFLGWLYRFIGAPNYYSRMMLKEWTLAGATQSHVAGTTEDAGSHANSCGSGTAGSACFLHNWGPRAATWDSHASKWVYIMTDSATGIVQTVDAGGTVATLATLPRVPFNLAVRHDGTHKQIYYCSDIGGSVYRLYKYNVDTTTETALTWPITGITCDTSSRIWYDSGRASIIFVYKRGAQAGVAEYINP